MIAGSLLPELQSIGIFPAQPGKTWFLLLAGNQNLNRRPARAVQCMQWVPSLYRTEKALILLSQALISWSVLNFHQDYGCPPDTRAPKGQGKSHCFNEEPGHTEPSKADCALGSIKKQTKNSSATRKVAGTQGRSRPPLP